MRAVNTLAAFGVLMTLVTYAKAAKCNCECPFNYVPLCAVDSKGNEETYPNECSLDCYKCTHKENLVIRYREECSDKLPSRTPDRSEKQKTAVHNSNSQRTSSTKCNCECPFNNSPLCAVDSKGTEQTYPNQCFFECYKCTHGKDLRIRSQGECSDKTSGQTARISNMGNSQKPSTKCNCKCTLNYVPVCTVDSKGVQETYPNVCAFECYKCTTRKDLRILKQGECSEKASPPPSRPTGISKGQGTQTSKCRCQCTLNYSPVCAIDPRGIEETYPNSCSFECYKCTHGKDLRILKRGECSNKTTPRPSRPMGNNNGQRTPASKCKCQCPLSYAPVCVVSLSYVQETYPSRCAFECYTCTHGKDFMFVKEGACADISGSRRNNPKPPINNKNCKCNCGLDYNPLCAVNSKGAEDTFPNQCALDCYNCTHKEDFVVRRRGECQSRTTQFPPRSKSRTA